MFNPVSEYYQGCQPGWEKYGDYCYMANVNKMTFEAAQDECAAKGGADLVSIHDAAESAFVETLNEGPECPDDGSEEEYEFEFLVEHDISAVQEVLIDPIAEDQEEFHGWSEGDVNALQVKVDRKTLQRISLLDPGHYISDLSMVDINEMKCWELVKE